MTMPKATVEKPRLPHPDSRTGGFDVSAIGARSSAHLRRNLAADRQQWKADGIDRAPFRHPPRPHGVSFRKCELCVCKEAARTETPGFTWGKAVGDALARARRRKREPS